MQLTPREKKLLQIAGVVLPLLLITWFLFLRPEGGEDVALPGFPSGATGPTGATGVTPSVSPSPTPRETLPPVSLAGARDPFSIPPGLAPTGGSVSPTTTTTGAPPTTTTATPPTTTFTTPPTTTPPTTTPPTTPPPEEPGDKILIGGHDVQLLEVAGNGNKLKVEVDGQVWTVEPGAMFAENFKLVRIDGRCAKFLFGDQSFELCEKG
ncbi:MAG: hypothetical protein L0206_09670 [Actinobacteria bacterium]|nr:hypothetical protein [Actinomycetota bacterium]